MTVYDSDFSVETKADASPVTEADQRAEDIILQDLHTAAPDIPVISEEAASDGKIPDVGDIFFLVDPLDGTREFIKKNGEFTVNIALIEHNRPVIGVVYTPAKSRLFWAAGPDQAFEAHWAPENARIEGDRKQIAVRTPPETGLTVVSSRSHGDPATQAMVADYQIAETINAGSSLKFCLIAAAQADIYPRAGRTMEWDTAAGHAVLNAAGGRVLTGNGEELGYGKKSDGFANPGFLAIGRK